MGSSKVLSDVLKRDGNNFDILRLIAAVAVIIGHSYSISPQPPYQDWVASVLHFDYSGSLAVKFFFFLSGVLVTNSIIAKPNPFLFFLKRAFRIFPGLFVCLLVSVFVVGPLFTTLPLNHYFSASETWEYFFKTFFLTDMVWRLPGVFDASRYGLNGSLWTLPYEVLCYLFTGIFYGLGLLRNKIFANIFFLGIVSLSFIFPVYLPTFFSQNPESFYLPGCFALGALAANNKNSIPVTGQTTILIWLLAIILRNAVGHQFMFYVALFYTLIWLSSFDWVKSKLKLPFDASYGVYIYGFLVQQCIHAWLPDASLATNQFLSITIALIIGILSWYLVEKRFIDLGNTISKKNISFSFASVKNLFIKPGSTGGNLPEKTSSIFGILVIIAFGMHFFVFKFIFPGYYNPLIPQHSDFYIPAAFAHSDTSFTSLLFESRPVSMIYAKLAGYLGIQGCIIPGILIVFANCALTALLVKRFFNLKFNGAFIGVFALYCYLLFSEPFFYMFYIQDGGTHLSFLFLLLGTLGLSHFQDSSFKTGILILFCCALLAFLSKETYGLTAIGFAIVWLAYKKNTSIKRAWMPLLAVGAALIISFAVNIFSKSIYFNISGSANSPYYNISMTSDGALSQSSYHVSMNPKTVIKELLKYGWEGINIINIIMVGLIFFAVVKYRKDIKNPLLFLTIGCFAGVALSLLPNSLLPNHHFKGYSFNGAYFLFLPLLFLPFIYNQKYLPKGIFIAIIFACVISPFFNFKKYNGDDNKWVLIQENTQKNLLGDLDSLMKEIKNTGKQENVLIQGITFPFHPFAFPQSLRTFSNAKYALFDVVNYNPLFVNYQQKDLVRFIDPANIQTEKYDKEWEFGTDGKLINSRNFAAERFFSGLPDNELKKTIDQNNFSEFSTSGFYNPENGISWTNGNSFIRLNTAIANTDSVVIELQTYLPTICRNIKPKVFLIDTENKKYSSDFSSKKENSFKYLFKGIRDKKIIKISIKSEIIDASPDQRILSFPFINLSIKPVGLR